MSMHAGRGGRQSGMALVELVLGLGVISLISILGLRALRVGLEGMTREAAYQEESASIAQLREAIRGAMDSRLAHAPVSEFWLKIEGTMDTGGDALNRLWIRTASEAGEVGEWRLERGASGWLINGRPIAFNGEIRVQPGALTCLAGERPPILHFRFPGAERANLRQGFAIVALW